MAEGGGKAQTFSTRAAARILAVSPDRIRYWVRRRLINPAVTDGRQYRFAFNDLLVMRLAKELLPSRRHLEPIQRCFERVRALLGPGRQVTSLKLSDQAGTIVVRERRFSFEAESGQLLLDFDALPRLGGTVSGGLAAKRAREMVEEIERVAGDDSGLMYEMFGNLLQCEPRTLRAHLERAAMMEAQGELTSALKHLLSAATIDPANAEVYIRLGRLHRRRGETDNAIKSFLHAVKCDSASLNAHRNLAELFEKMGRKREALRHLSAVHRLTRGD
ncbi:MAG: MerR family transcriptional regulator [Candidatus Binataceae bacterium]